MVLAIVTLLMAMLGCQGVSARSDSDPPPPPAQLTASSASLAFGTVAVGTIQVLPETVTNNGTSSLSLTTVSVTGTGFTVSGLSLPMVLGAGQSTSFNVVFQPPSVVTGATGNVALANTGTNGVLGIALSGSGATPAAVTASPNGYSFGTVAMGSMVTENETLTNAGTDNVTISQVTVIGTGFGVINLNLPLTLAPSQTTTFGVTFSPVAAPGTDGAVVLTVNGVSNAVYLGYSGSGGSTAAPAVVVPTPASLTFSNVTTGQSSSQTMTLTNTGGVSTTVSAATASGTGYSVSGFTAGTLLPGASMSFSVTFAPTAGGQLSGNGDGDVERFGPKFFDSVNRNGGGATGGSDGIAHQFDVHECHRGTGLEPDRDDHEYGRDERDDFCGRGVGSRVQCFWNHAAGDVDAGSEHDLHGDVHADQRYHVQRNGDGDLERIEPELIDCAEWDGGRGAGGSNGDADELDLHEYHGGADFEPDGNDQEHGRHERDDFRSRGVGNRVQHFRDHDAGDVDGGTEHDVHGEVCADQRGHVPGNGDGDVERIESELDDSFERDGGDCGDFDSIADESDLHEHHGGADLEPNRNDPEHGRDERNDLGGRGIGNRVQHFRNHAAGDVDGGTERDVHGEVCADFRWHVPRNGDRDVERIEPELVDTFERDIGGDTGSADGIADEFDLHEHHGGADFESDRNDPEHGRHERDNFSGRGVGDGVQHFRDHTAGDVDGGTEHHIYGNLRADHRGHVPWNGDGDLERIEPELVDTFERDGSGSGSPDPGPRQPNLHEHHGGADLEPNRNDPERGRHERDNFGGCGIGNRVQHFRNHAAGDTDGGTEHDLHGDVCADICGHVPGNRDRDLERIEPKPVDTFEWHGSDCGYFDSDAHELNLHEHHGGADFESNRNPDQHGRHDCHDLGGRGIGNRVQHFRDHTAGDVDGGTERDLHGDFCADVCGHVPWNGDGDLERIEPELVDTFERDIGGDTGSADGVADQFDLHEHHGGADLEPNRNDPEHGRHERDNFGGCGIGNRVQHFRNHTAGDVDGGTEHDLHGEVCPDVCGHVPRNGDGDLRCFEPEFIDTFEWDGCAASGSLDGIADKFDLHEYHGGAEFESDRNADQHGRHECNNLSGRGIGNRVQCFRDHAAGDADARTEHDLHGDLCADQRYYVQRNGDGDLERFEPDLIDTADRNSGRDARSSDGVTDEFDLHERHGGANLESNRNPDQHGRHNCHDLGGRGIGNRV
jgi:hypothetical protein